jgi:hypothetical protein
MEEYLVVWKKDQIRKYFSFSLMTIQMKAHSHFEDLLNKKLDNQTSNARNGWLMTKVDHTCGDVGSAVEIVIDLDLLII